MEEKMLNQILKEITCVKENQNTMAVQIADLAIGQNKLSEKIDNVRSELKNDMSELRTELKTDMEELRTELKTDMANLRTELKNELKEEIAGVRVEFKEETTSIKEELRKVREIAEFTKDTCESIIRVCTNEFKKQDSRYKVLKLMIEDNREKYQNHEYRICNLETKLKNKNYIPTL